MHTEHIAVRRQTIEKLLAHGCEATAVGTTSVRTLESLYYMGVLASKGEDDLHVPQWFPYSYATEAAKLTVEEGGVLNGQVSVNGSHTPAEDEI